MRLWTELTNALPDLFALQPLNIALPEKQTNQDGGQGGTESSESDVFENVENTDRFVQRIEQVIEHEMNLARLRG